MGQGLDLLPTDFLFWLRAQRPSFPTFGLPRTNNSLAHSTTRRNLRQMKSNLQLVPLRHHICPVAMEPPGGIPPDRDKLSVVHQQPNISTPSTQQNLSLIAVSAAGQQSLERLSRPMAFDKMESLVREMQDAESGVPVRQQKMFLTSIPYAFMGKHFEVPVLSTNIRETPYVGYDLIEWLMDRLGIEESEALSIANQLCLHGYFFPVNDTKSLIVKDDSSLYRFQTPYYWPWQHKAPDNVEYAIYLAKRSLRNKQRHGLEDYESEALASLHKNLKGKWDFISMQAEEQVRLAKERKKGDKIVGDSQERAYWRVHRPPPGQFTPLEPCPVPSRDRQGIKPKKKTIEDWKREVDYLKKSLGRTRMKMSQACESLVSYWETFADYDFFIQPVLPSNPWVSEDTTFWQLNNAIVDIPTEKRVKRWAISIEELVSDPTGLQEFTTFLEKEYSHENIRFWIAVNRLRRSAHSQVAKKVNEIYEEFLKPGAPCEINIDGKTMEVVQKGLKNPSRFTFDAAAEHIYMLLLKKDCYPRFIRSDHYKSLLASGIQPSHKKRFFGFGGVAKKKTSTAQAPNQGLLTQSSTSGVPPPGHLSRRRGSDRSLTGSAHELAIIGVKDNPSSTKVPHSHSQSNLSEIPYSVTVYRGDMPTEGLALDVTTKDSSSSGLLDACSVKLIQEGNKPLTERLETTAEIGACAVCPWETPDQPESSVLLSVCPWEDNSETAKKNSPKRNTSTSSEITEVSERMRRSCGLRQNTVDSDYSSKRLMPHVTEQRRASMTMAPRISEFQFSTRQGVTRASTTPSPTAFVSTEENVSNPSLSKECTIESEGNVSIAVIAMTPDKDPASDDNRNESINEEKCEKSELKTLDFSNDNSTNNNKQESVVLQLNTDKNSEMISSTSQGTTPSIHVECHIADSSESPTAIGNDSPEIAGSEDVRMQEDKEDQHIDTDVSPVIEEGNEEEPVPQEELSPTTEEYQECAQFGEQAEVFEYDIVDVEANLTPGCVAPAPTPAPSLAPLAEIEMDPVDEDPECIEQKPEVEETKKKRKKRDSDAKKNEEKAEGSSSQPKMDQDNRNAVCPWEDENVTASDTPFVKTYATLGYL